MATCACCGTTVFFGKRAGPDQYCNDNCLGRGPILSVGKTVPDYLVQAEAEKIFKAPCPVCRGAGPTDVHTSHTIWSAVLVTSWNSKSQFSCKPCGVKRQLLATLQSGLLGWWGFPWGILGTPVTIMRNLFGMGTKIGAARPSSDLLSQTRSLIAMQSIEQSRRTPAA
ncbi:MAG TPA: hypothetical protein VFQ84_09435 [Arenimonas sp.]|uniref:hypothetical protein n=1 Tax=Arenimonas sp. TaxID=1872635 RepID=UPI002D80BC88|nr:hypothetical protein [Arenimonas sp.]HEU0153554.1 hypothetical protein [Arenimonas sp.]